MPTTLSVLAAAVLAIAIGFTAETWRRRRRPRVPSGPLTSRQQIAASARQIAASQVSRAPIGRRDRRAASREIARKIRRDAWR